MKRLHLFEFTDLEGCPPVIRGLLTDFLQVFFQLCDPYAEVVPRLARAIRAAGANRIVDLCSGAAGPLPRVHERLRQELGGEVDVVLTDKFPHPEAVERIQATPGGRISYAPQSVDATAVPQELSGFRTLFEAFHHFNPEQARAILQDAVDRRAGIGVFEVTRRSVGSLLTTPMIPAAVYLLTPFIRPLSLSRVLLTYAMPVAPAVISWDSFVSNLRTYSEQELREMTASLSGPEYTWEIGNYRFLHMTVTYLIGHPALGPEAAN